MICTDDMIEKQRLLWNAISCESKKIEVEMKPLERKRTGSYFTGLDLTDAMMSELVEQIIADGKNIWELSFLEPCVGTGNFVFSYLKKIYSIGINKEQAIQLLDNIYVADINNVALDKYKELLYKFAETFFDIRLEENYFLTHIGTGLLIDITSEKNSYIKIMDVFDNELAKKGFDIVVTNPPYKNLKAEKSQYSNDIEYEKDKLVYTAISKLVNKEFSYSTDGVLNLYKIFVEEIICNYAKPGGYVDVLIPASILSDKTCSRLRTYMLTENSIISVKVIAEGSGYVDAQQALCALLLKKEHKTEFISMTKDFCDNPSQVTIISIDDILNCNTGNAIFAINNQEYTILKKLRKLPTVKDLPFIINLRGELDLTANKKAIVSENTGYPLLRGRNINYYAVVDLNNNEYISEDFVRTSKKAKYIHTERIICQQVVNMHKARRVTFAYIEPNYVLGNSCNFVSVLPNEYGIDIFTLLGLFNTSIINWFFKLTSSNNHVNNYEIDCFPIPVKSEFLNKIGVLAKEYLKTKNEDLLEEIEEYAYLAYNIKHTEDATKVEELSTYTQAYFKAISYLIPEMSIELAEKIITGNASLDAVLLQLGIDLDKFNKKIVDGITDKFIKMSKSEILNHTTFKLSDLDMEMIKAVPQGGSWKDIPMETVEKSKRLKRITQTGGRTTLYGRIDYTKPSYTITTYFNRPGNGTYVHPVHDRVLSVREAARFQGFRDDYYFFGNKTQMLKQVGNAVPTILAYQIARQIIDKTSCRKSIDLFCGAGGMTSGFKAAGIESVLSNDIEESACITLKINNPEIDVFCGDITTEETKNYVVATALKEQADIICGGPPCQGFSMAGFRLTDDPRNQLFKDFIGVVERVKPKVIVFENVEGLLSFQGGKVYKAIHELFTEVGYRTEGRILMANEYAVPQKRKRVIIICTRNDLNVEPSELFPCTITEKTDSQITAHDTIYDLEDVECGEKAIYDELVHSDIVQLFKSEIDYETYLSKCGSNAIKLDVSNDYIVDESTGQISFKF